MAELAATGEVPRAGLCDCSGLLRLATLVAGDIRLKYCWKGGGVEDVDEHLGGGGGGTSPSWP